MSKVEPHEVSATCAWVAQRTGTSLSRQQLHRLNAAIEQRRGKRGEGEYLHFLQSVRGTLELVELMSVISVHKTDLFRDEGQLEVVREQVLVPLAAQRRPLSVWSAGCASGEEVATLLILLAEVGAHAASTVLGTDISERVLSSARSLAFSSEVLRRVPEPLRAKYFLPRPDGQFELQRTLAARADFRRHNLMDLPYPLPAASLSFDLIFCRNVLIYFSAEAFEHVVSHLVDRLAPNGVLVLSAAEPLLKARADLELKRFASSFLYVKREKPVPVRPSAPPAPRLSAPAPRPPSSAPARPSAPLAFAGRPATQELPLITDPKEEGVALFHLVLEWAAAGEPDAETEAGLRKCLYLVPELACARYLLGKLLEQRAANADAAAEYRRALQSLQSGNVRAAPFFLNNERLFVVCQAALERLGYR